MKKFTPFLAVLACVSLLQGRQLERSCGTYTNNWREELDLHRRSQAAQPRVALKAGGAKQAVKLLPDIGNIAHLDDADGIIARRNVFNLNGLTIRFVPSPGSKSYRYETAAGVYDNAAAASGNALAGLGDDDSREISLSFAFPFYGSEHRSVFVNSDGNLTFGKGDVEITDRSLGRMLAGAPRIAAQFNDLDPSRPNAAVKVRNEANRVVISWDNVPEYSSSGRGPTQRFQMRLFRDGVVELAFASGTPSEAVTGIAPGGLKGDPSLVSFASGTSSEYLSSVVERFTDSESVDIFAAAQKFYRNHEDTYDYLAIYNTMDIDAGSTAVAYEVTVRNNRTGYGDDVPTEVGEQAGSRKRLQAILNMGPLSQYPTDPNAKVPARLTVGDTPLSTIAHEMGHLFLSYVSVEDEDGGTPMLGHQSAHWDFKFNSEASLMEGNRIQDNGSGASPRFVTAGAVEGYSALDQYLMGFRAPEEVPDTFYVKDTRGASTTGLPRTGVAFDGTRVNVTMREILDASGRRTPDHTVSQRHFRVAFLVITRDGQTPTAAQLAQLEAYRSNLQDYFSRVTGQKATVDTVLQKSLTVSAFPAFGVVANRTAPVTVSAEQPVTAALTLQVRSANGRVRTPATVTIPAGGTQATFEVAGLAEGTDDLVVEPANSQFASVTSKVQVAQLANLNLKVVSDASPVRVRVVDVNNLPYPGVTVGATASAGGSLDRNSTVTDNEGIAEFRWVQSTQGNNSVVASVSGGPTVSVAAGAAPAFTVAGVLNAASYVPGLTPGGIGTLFGANLGGQNATVTLGGRPADVLFANASQINFVTPADLSEGTVELVVRSGNAVSAAVAVPVRPVQPGIFFDTATSVGAITIAGSAQLTTEQPPAGGEQISIYATGLGAVRPPSASGLEETVLQPEVSINGTRAQVTYSGLAPGFVGLYQLNVVVPPGTPAGTATVAITAAGARSNDVRIRVR